MADEKKAREIAPSVRASSATSSSPSSRQPSWKTFSTRWRGRRSKTLPLIIKADVQGSQEALVHALLKLSTDRTRSTSFTVQSAAYQSDINSRRPRRLSSSAFIDACRTGARRSAENFGVDIRYYNIICAPDEVKDGTLGMLAPGEEGRGHWYRQDPARSSARRSVPSPDATCSTALSGHSRARLLRGNVVKGR